MACTTEIRINDVGIRFTITIEDYNGAVVDLSTATVLDIILTKPSGATLTKAGILLTDGTDGNIYFDSIAGDFDEAGYWSIQGVVEIGSSKVHHSSIKRFRVYSNL